MSFPFFFKEAVRGLSRNSAPALAAMLTVLLTALVLGVFIPIVQATTGTANEVRDRVVVNVYIADEATKAERQQLAAALERTTNVKSVEYVSNASGFLRSASARPSAFETNSTDLTLVVRSSAAASCWRSALVASSAT